MSRHALPSARPFHGAIGTLSRNALTLDSQSTRTQHHHTPRSSHRCSRPHHHLPHRDCFRPRPRPGIASPCARSWLVSTFGGLEGSAAPILASGGQTTLGEWQQNRQRQVQVCVSVCGLWVPFSPCMSVSICMSGCVSGSACQLSASMCGYVWQWFSVSGRQCVCVCVCACGVSDRLSLSVRACFACSCGDPRVVVAESSFPPTVSAAPQDDSTHSTRVLTHSFTPTYARPSQTQTHTCHRQTGTHTRATQRTVQTHTYIHSTRAPTHKHHAHTHRTPHAALVSLSRSPPATCPWRRFGATWRGTGCAIPWRAPSCCASLRMRPRCRVSSSRVKASTSTPPTPTTPPTPKVVAAPAACRERHRRLGRRRRTTPLQGQR